MNNNGNKRAPTTATQRLKQDYLRIKKDPVPYICAEPLPSNILEWWGVHPELILITKAMRCISSL